MYNLFVTAHCEAWDGTHYEFPRSRCLSATYTDKEISATYSGLTESDCTFLMTLPCLFAYETLCERSARTGRITRIRTKGDEVRIEYEIAADAAEISPEQMLELNWDLGLGNWEMGHTHWAVKREDLSAALS